MPIPRGYPTSGYRPGSEQYQEAYYQTPYSDLTRGMTPPPMTPQPPAGPMAEPATPYPTQPTFKGGVTLAPTLSGPPTVPQINTSVITPERAAIALARVLGRVHPALSAAAIAADIIRYYWGQRANQEPYQVPGVGTFYPEPLYYGWEITCDNGGPRNVYNSSFGHNFSCGLRTTTRFPGTSDPFTTAYQDSLAPLAAATQIAGWQYDGLDFIGRDQWTQSVYYVKAGGDDYVGPIPNFNITVLPVEDSDPHIPYKAIPKQKEWDHPNTERGNSVGGGNVLSPVQKSAFDTAAGNTYYVEVPPAGPLAGGSGIPRADRPGGSVYSQPPNDRVRERKITINQNGVPMRVFGTLTEFSEFVTCLFTSVPLKQRLKDGVTKRIPRAKQKSFMTAQGEIKTARNVNVGVYKQAKYLYEHYNDVNIAQAIDCWRSSEATDAVIGKYSSAANNAAVKNPYWVSPKGIGGGFGP